MSEFRRRLAAHGKPGGTGESPEFIEFRHDKYVDTGIIVDSELKVSLKIKFHSANASANIIGRWGSPYYTTSISGASYSRWYVLDTFNGDNFRSEEDSIVDLKVGNIIEIVKDRNKLYIDNVLKVEHPYSQMNSGSNTLIGGNNVTFDADVYAFSIWQDDVLVDEYIPYVENGKEYFRGKNTGKLLEVLTINK